MIEHHLKVAIDGIVEPLPPISANGRDQRIGWAVTNTALCVAAIGVCMTAYVIHPWAGAGVATLLFALESVRAVLILMGRYTAHYPVDRTQRRLAAAACAISAAACPVALLAVRAFNP
jgi:hypothetical protein